MPSMKNKSKVEKPKDLKKSISRLFKELKSFKILIGISLILAMAGAILSILAPNKLSNITDEISAGLVVKSDNLEEITKKITSNLSEENMSEIIPDILSLKLDQESIKEIMISNNILDTDKQKLQNVLNSITNSNTENIIYEISNLPDEILNIILPDSTYDDILISSEDKINLSKIINQIKEGSLNNIEFPDSIQQILFKDFTIDKTIISSEDQIKFFNIISDIDKNKMDVNTLYKKIDQMPSNIQKVVKPYMNIDKIKSISLFLAILYVFSALFTYIQSITMTDVSNKFAKILRSKISIKINKLPLKYFDKNKKGDILSRVTNDIDTIAQTMNQSLATLVSSITLFVGTIIVMFVTNYVMAITAILSSLIGFIFMFIILGKSQKYFISRQIELGNLNGHIEEVYSGLIVVKAYNGKSISDKIFDEYNQKVYEANRKSQFLSGLMHPIMTFIGNFGYLAVCIVGALLTMNDIISFGVIVAFITYVRLFTSPLSQIAQAFTSLQSTFAASERVFEFIDETEMGNQTDIKRYLDKTKVKGKIEFKNVSFRYDDNKKDTIKNFTVTAKPGQKIAIVGPTGAGKTTMVNLLMKFYEINKGEIRIDGISTKELSRENIHEMFTMVLQDTWLFNGTIKENIIYNRENITDEQVEEVCKIVGLNHFIKTLPNGYNSKLNDNDSISAGQKQLLTIARGMLEDSPFLILDEATSNVDTRTEELVASAMDKLTEGKTSFIIAHRLSTIKNADLILVMKDGNIIEQGNHEELMNKKGFYSELYNSQFEL